MIVRIRGIVLEKSIPFVLVEAGGIGYEIHMPIKCFQKLPEVGKEVIIFTHFIIRKETYLLFGFRSKQKRTLFQNLIKINGIGPKLAIEILSSISVQQFVNAIKQRDFNVLMQLPGIGKKTADRLIIEMKDRCKSLYHDDFLNLSLNLTKEQNTLLEGQAKQEAISALIALGYKPRDAFIMVNKVSKPDADSEILIREALRRTLL